MRFLKLVLFLILVTFFANSVFAVNIPKYSGRVNDFANIFSSDFKNSLEQKILEIESQTTDQIAVVTIKNLQGTTVEDFAEQLFKSWGIGQKDKDNGILLLVSMEEKKVRIEIGYGLEATITDGQAGEIIRNQITPEFKKGNYQQGVLSGIEKINQYLTGNVTNDSSLNEKPKINNFILELISSTFFIPIVLFYLAISYFFAFLARSSSYYLGGVVGAFGGLMTGVSSPLLIKIILIIILGLIGLILDYILSKNYKKLKERGWDTNFWRSGGGFGGGSSSGGGGGGGFGGGSSGGGGASGGW